MSFLESKLEEFLMAGIRNLPDPLTEQDIDQMAEELADLVIGEMFLDRKKEG